MNRAKFFIPHLFTLLNLLMGCVAIVFAAHHHLIEAAIFVAFGIFFDFFDGFFARLLKVSSVLGKQLDSLADVITSGVVPGFVLFQMLRGDKNNDYLYNGIDNIDWIPFLGFLITLGSAYRLGKFNIDENQKNSFIGLPTPANAIFIVSLPIITRYEDLQWVVDLIESKSFLIGVTLLCTYALNMPLRLFSLKVKNFSLKTHQHLFVMVLVSIFLLVSLSYTAIPLIVVLYVLLSVIYNKTAKDFL